MTNFPVEWFEEAAKLAEQSEFEVRVTLVRGGFLVGANQRAPHSANRASAAAEVTFVQLLSADLNPFPKVIREVERRLVDRLVT